MAMSWIQFLATTNCYGNTLPFLHLLFHAPLSYNPSEIKPSQEGNAMGVFAERIYAVFCLLPWRSENASADLETHGASKERLVPVPTRVTSYWTAPSSSVLRADLEAMRRRP
jgi:hypothetical protein